MTKNKYSPIIILLLLLILPILLWLNAPSPQPHFSDFSTTFSNIGQIFSNIGQIFSLVGVVLFAVNLILSTRLRALDVFLNGLNNLYIKHSQIGQIAFILLLFHPLLLIPKYASNIHEAAAFLWLDQDWAKNWGILALYLMIFLIVLTLYLRPKYNIWKWTHKFLGFAFFLASLHIWLIPSDTSRYFPLKAYILTFSALGLVAFVYKSVLGRFLIRKYKYVVTNVLNLNNDVIEIRLKPQNKKLMFKPGQFVFLNFINKNTGLESHPFSLTSLPDDSYISFSIKNLGDYTSTIREMAMGTPALIEGPFGVFSFKNASKKSQLWIAGGIGITPFVSMAKYLITETTYTVDLIYCVKNKYEAVYFDLLKNISEATNGRFNIIAYCSDDSGRISFEVLNKLVNNMLQKDIFICAPPAMIQALKKQFILNGINKSNIYSEEFSF